ncbi:MAG TPA: hypothetical protein VFM54_17085 [Micromonosporaceae bacterium]|nr:hypothetical protein [Micromonosporaceae bacterium]
MLTWVVILRQDTVTLRIMVPAADLASGETWAKVVREPANRPPM